MNVVGCWLGTLLSVTIDIKSGIITSVERLREARNGDPMMLPGRVDLHVHHRYGQPEKDTLEAIEASAFAGGTTFIGMVGNGNPPLTTMHALRNERIARKQHRLGSGLWFVANNNNLDDIAKALQEPDVLGCKIFYGSTTGNILVNNHDILRQILRLGTIKRSYRNGEIRKAIFTIHLEKEEDIQRRLARYNGKAQVADHPDIRHWQAEYNAACEFYPLILQTDARVLCFHVSSIATARYLLERQLHYLNEFFIEVTPHHMFLSAEDMRSLKRPGILKMNPPLRPRDITVQLRDFFEAGFADTLGSDHANHERDKKLCGSYDRTPSGIGGLESAYPLVIDRMLRGKISQWRVAFCAAENPAAIAGLKHRGIIAPGNRGDLVLIDPKGNTVLSHQTTFNPSGLSAYDGMTLKGRIVQTILGGKIVYQA